MAKALRMEASVREFDGKVEVWGYYPQYQVKDMDKPYTKKPMVVCQLLAFVGDNMSQAKRFMQNNLRRGNYVPAKRT